MKEFSSTISTHIRFLLQSLNGSNSDSVIRELTSALQQSNREKMGDTKVETISRLAQWKIDNFGPCSYKKFDSFKLGLWSWHIAIEKNRYLNVRLFPEPSRQSKDQPPLARFILRVSNLGIS